jgi:hypothetical protein
MRRLVPTNWCFLFYWVFLVNFGPSFHHADLFGLHSHSSSRSHSGFHHSHEQGCCNHDHGADDGHRHDRPQNLETSIVSVFAADGECACCKFFDQYNVCFNCLELVGHHTFGIQRFSATEGRPSAGDLKPHARGPPSVIALG